MLYLFLYFTALIAEPVVSEKSFEWLKMMRYQMDIRNVLRAKTEAVESGAPPVQTDPVELKRKMSRTRRTSQIAMKARMAAIGNSTYTNSLYYKFLS